MKVRVLGCGCSFTEPIVSHTSRQVGRGATCLISCAGRMGRLARRSLGRAKARPYICDVAVSCTAVNAKLVVDLLWRLGGGVGEVPCRRVRIEALFPTHAAAAPAIKKWDSDRRAVDALRFSTRFDRVREFYTE